MIIKTKLIYINLIFVLWLIPLNLQAGNFYLDTNGVTIKCESASEGDSEVVNGVTYTKISSKTDLVINGGSIDATQACTSGITDMSGWFLNKSTFDKNVSHWDTSSVTTMYQMFESASTFNQDISKWNTSAVTNMGRMLRNNPVFNQPIGEWNTSNVTDMQSMFKNDTSFNQPLANWDTSKVTLMNGLFASSGFNQPIGNWDVSKVTVMSIMFENNANFNQDISDWNTSSATNMSYMFSNASSFNQNISNWDTSNVTDMTYMLRQIPVFSQDLSMWCVSGIGSKPTQFDTTSGFENQSALQPQWGTCPSISLDVLNLSPSEHNLTLIKFIGEKNTTIYHNTTNYNFFSGAGFYSLALEVNNSSIENETWWYNFSNDKIYLDNNGSSEFKREINGSNKTVTANLNSSNWLYYKFGGTLFNNDKNVSNIKIVNISNGLSYEDNLSNGDIRFDINFSASGTYKLSVVTDNNKSWYYNFATGEFNSTDIGSTISLSDSNLTAHLNLSHKKFDDFIVVLSEYQSLSIGLGYTVALKGDGTLWSWGMNKNGELGDGTFINRDIPMQIGTDSDWQSVSASQNSILALKNDGTLWGWGLNNYGQLGDGTSTYKNIPTQIGTDSDWQSISAGYFHSLAIKSDGTLWAWGDNRNGELGDGTTTDKTSPIKIGTDTNWQKVEAGALCTFALKSDGTLWAWGQNTYGQLGDGTTVDKNSSIQIGTDTDWKDIYSYARHVLALKNDGTLWAWGWNHNGQLGDGSVTDRSSPAQVGTDSDWQIITAGNSHSSAIKSDGTLWAWGDNGSGQLGDGTTTDRKTPVQVGSFEAIYTGYSNVIAKKSDGTLWAWGSNEFGQLGTTTSTRKDTPTKISIDKWKDTSTGEDHTVAVKSDGTLWAWGLNGEGQLGDGTTDDKTSPIQIGSDTNWQSVSAGVEHTLALKSDGTLWAWGYNGYGQFGDGTYDERLSPTQIGSDTNWKDISTSEYNTVAVKSNGTLWAWGDNGRGQLGDGTTDDKLSPIQIGSDTNWQSASINENHTVAIKSDGTIWAWGENSEGQLGDGTTTNRTSPVQIGSDTNWKDIFAGYNYTTAVKSDGTLWSWGNNIGQYGNQIVADDTIPTKIGTDSDWKAIFEGYEAMFAIKNDGTLWACGDNFYGELGDGTSTDLDTLTKIGSDTNWYKLSIYDDRTVAIKSDGTIWAWGYNLYGQLGFVDGYRDNPSPINVTTTIYKIPLLINLNDVNKSEHNVTSIRIYGIDGKFDELNLSMITDGDNNFTKALYPDNNYSIELNVSKDGVESKWYYNFSDGVTYLNNTSTSDFQKEINLANRSLNIDLSSIKWENFDAIFTPSQTSLDFGSIAEYSTSSLPLTITNSGKSTGVVEFSLNSTDFSVSPSSCSLEINASCQVNVTFSAISTNSYSDILSIKDSATNTIKSVALSGNGYSNYVYVPPTTTQNTIINSDDLIEVIDSSDISINIEENEIVLSDGGESTINNGDISNIEVNKKEDGSTTYNIKYNSSNENLETEAKVELKTDGTTTSTLKVTDLIGNTLETNVLLPKNSKVSLDKTGDIIHNLKSEGGVDTKVTTFTKGNVELNLKSNDGEEVKTESPIGTKVDVAEDGSFKQSLELKNTKTEVIATKRADVKTIIEKESGEALELNPPKGAKVKVNSDNSISITNEVNTNDGYVTSQMVVNSDGTSSVEVEINTNARGVEPKKLIYSTRKNLSNVKLEVLLDEKESISRKIIATNSKSGRIKATFSTRKSFSFKDSNLRELEDFSVDITPEVKAEFEENLYFDESKSLKLTKSKADIKAIFSTRSSFDNKSRADISDKLQSSRKSFSIRADRATIKDSGEVSASLSEEDTITSIEANEEELIASILTYNQNRRDLRGKVVAKKIIYSARKSFSDIKLEVIEDSNLRSPKAKLKATYSTRSAFSFKNSNLRDINEIVVVPNEDANFTEEINKDGTRSLTLTSGSATINGKEMELNTPYTIPSLETVEVTQTLTREQNITLSLTKGWNLVSTPIDEDISDKFIFGDYDLISTYKNYRWYQNPNMIYHNEGFWIKSNINQDINFSGESYILNIKTIPTKWTLVGVGEEVTDIDNFKDENKVKEFFIYQDGNWTNSQNTKRIETTKGVWIEKITPDYTLELLKGWNLISLPTNEIVSDMSIFGDYTQILIYENGEWIENPINIKPMQGIWINVNEELKIAFYGDSYNFDNSKLNSDWSLVGGNIDFNELNRGGVNTIWIYKNDNWININSSNLNLIQIGDGIWIKKMNN